MWLKGVIASGPIKNTICVNKEIYLRIIEKQTVPATATETLLLPSICPASDYVCIAASEQWVASRFCGQAVR